MKRLELRKVVVPALDSTITLRVRQGEVVAVVVRPPAAVRQLADAVVGLSRGYDGEVLLHDEATGDPVPPVSERVAAVALVPASGGLLPHLSVRDNIGYGRRRGARVPAQRVHGKVPETARALDLLEVLERYPHEITAGRRQRVGLARALLRTPAALVLEDREDCPPWGAQADCHHALDSVATLIITPSAERVERLAHRTVDPAADAAEEV